MELGGALDQRGSNGNEGEINKSWSGSSSLVFAFDDSQKNLDLLLHLGRSVNA